MKRYGMMPVFAMDVSFSMRMNETFQELPHAAYSSALA